MNPIQIAAGIITGLVGAGVWAALGYYANLEVGYVAWGIGLLVGLAVAATGKTGVTQGILAVIITTVSIAGGKLATVQMQLSSEGFSTDSIMEELRAEGDNFLIRTFADEEVIQRLSQGEQIIWPSGMTFDDAYEPQHYPAEIWDAAQIRWEALSAQEQQNQLAQILSQTETNISGATSEIRTEALLGNFGLMDLVFYGLAIATAWRTTSRERVA